MEMQQLARWQLTNLELSKELKKLGVSQESLFYWVNIELKKNGAIDLEINDGYIQKDYKEYYSAFTVAELKLPFSIKQYPPHGEEISLFLYQFPPFSDRSFYEVAYLSGFGSILDHNETADTEANTRAKMRIYLIKNKLVKS